MIERFHDSPEENEFSKMQQLFGRIVEYSSDQTDSVTPERTMNRLHFRMYGYDVVVREILQPLRLPKSAVFPSEEDMIIVSLPEVDENGLSRHIYLRELPSDSGDLFATDIRATILAENYQHGTIEVEELSLDPEDILSFVERPEKTDDPFVELEAGTRVVRLIPVKRSSTINYNNVNPILAEDIEEIAKKLEKI